MARSIKPEEYENRRNEILNAAQRLVYTKGYEQMSIQEILDELNISKGAFYHYFDSKRAVLEAIIERIWRQMRQLIDPIVENESLSAVEKLTRVFDVAGRWKTDRKDAMLTLANAWYADENALLRLKVQAALVPQIAVPFTTIIRQGVEEGVFHTPHPEHVMEILFSLMQSFGDSMIATLRQEKHEAEDIRRLQALTESYQEAVERILGAEAGSLPLFDTTVMQQWLAPAQEPVTENNTPFQ